MLETQPNNADALRIAREEYQKKSRDNARTPVQWSSEANAGWTTPTAKPWMSVNPEYKTVNAEAQLKDPDSAFHYWARTLALRKEYLDIFVYGDFKMIDLPHEKIFAFSRQFESQKAAVVCNWSPDTVEWTNPEGSPKQILMNNYTNVDEAKGRFAGDRWQLKPYEAVVVLL